MNFLSVLCLLGSCLAWSLPCGDSLSHDYESLFARESLELQSRIKSEELNEAIAALFNEFQAKSARILDPFTEGYYLRGALMSAESVEDLKIASRMLSADAKHLEYFAARMAFFAFKHDQNLAEYPKYDPLSGAHAELQRFDRGNAINRGVRFDRKTASLSIDPLSIETVKKMQHHALPVSFEVTSGLRFNNGRAFTFLEHPWSELWSAQQIFEIEKDETLLAYGDKSTRQFFKYFRFHNGKLHREGTQAADYLSVRIRNGKPELVVRELKFHLPKNDVEVANALSQLKWTLIQLGDSLPQIPIRQIEIVVPQRASVLKRPKVFPGFSMGKLIIPKSNVFELLRGPNERVFLRVNNQRYQVLVRMLPTPP